MLMTASLPHLPDPEWDDQLAKLGGHVYQSSLWARFQQAQGREVLYEAGNGWSWLGALRHGRGGITYLYAAYGPTVQGQLEPAVTSLAAAGRAHRADFVRIEPLGAASEADLASLGARHTRDVQPRYRLMLDITPDEAQLRRAISSSNRNLINTATARGLSFEISSDPARVTEYLAMQRETAAHGGFKPHPDTYYHHLVKSLLPTGAARLYFANYQGKPVASAICVDFAKTRYYLYAATYPALNRELKAAVALLWWMILDAKAGGLSRFDYGGVAPDNQPNHPWAGHTRFKKSLGGEVVASVGTWDLPLKPVKYHLYHAARQVLPL